MAVVLTLKVRLDHGFRDFESVAVHLIVAKLLRDELALRGIRSLTIDESEAIAAHIFERITELELELAARDFNSTSPDKPT
ncbi:hypothetical protein AB8Z38_34555 [Bradyrhizobium sp. LLZ17]|uniref:Transposase n=1 Tax=Bradyrhizobium sp. LLZ17 TaxID=3239388 RepID=A0AB39XJJ4_9BRAD